MKDSRIQSKQRTVWFFIAAAIVFGAVFCLMLLIDCRWYAFVCLFAAAAALVIIRFKMNWHSWRKPVCWVAAVALSLLFLVFGRPDLKVSFAGTFAREGIRTAMQLPMLRGNGLFSSGEKMAKNETDWNVPKGYTNKKYDLSKSSVELLQKTGEPHQKLVYQLHGGGFEISLMNSYRYMAVRYSKLSGGADVASLDYRIAPANKHPAALDDAMEGWTFLLAQGYKPENIILAGDSAGGNLALSLTEKLRDEGKPLPAAIIGMSPWADLADEGASHTYNLYKDPMFGIRKGTLKPKGGPPVYAGSTGLHDKYLSPVYADFRGFPPMLLQAGTWEVLESDSVTVYEKAKAAGADVKLTEYRGMFHVFQMAGNLIPESKAAWEEVTAFLIKHFNK